MSNSISVFAPSACIVTFVTKKGDMKSISAEGALFKGGLALASLKDIAMDSALGKAANGRYMAASDILEGAFPTVAKAVWSLIGAPSANKASFCTLLGGLDRMEEPKKGWSKKQVVARGLLRALRTVPALAREEAADILEAA